MQGVASIQSKFGLSNLTLSSIVELERLKAGMEYDGRALENLSAALLKMSNPTAAATQFGFIEPAYYDSFERLYVTSGQAEHGGVERIQAYIRELSEQLHGLAESAEGQPEPLLAVCMNLHRELVQELSAEDDKAGHEWSEFRDGFETSICAA